MKPMIQSKKTVPIYNLGGAPCPNQAVFLLKETPSTPPSKLRHLNRQIKFIKGIADSHTTVLHPYWSQQREGTLVEQKTTKKMAPP